MNKRLIGIINSIALTLPIEASKMFNFKVKDDDLKKSIMQNHLFHFSSKEGVDAILDSGYIRPSGMVSSHFTRPKVFMFNGLPDVDILRKNLSYENNPFYREVYEFNAVEIMPSEYDLSFFKFRKFSDGAICKDGKYFIDKGSMECMNGDVNMFKNCAVKRKIVLDLDKDNRPTLRFFDEEKDKCDENGKYIPNDVVKEFFDKERENNNFIDESITQFYIDGKLTYSSIKDSIIKFFNRFRTKKLAEPKVNEENYDIESNFTDELSSNVESNIESLEKNSKVRDDDLVR